MALVAMTTSDNIKHVSDLDPAKKVKDVPVDPADPTKGTKKETEIDMEKATVFALRPLDVYLMGHIYDTSSVLTGKQGKDEIGIHTKVNKTNIDTVKFGLVGWSNFKDANKNLVQFSLAKDKEVVNDREYSVASDATLDFLGLRLINELANKIKAISEVSASEEKNSEPALQQSA